MLHSHCNVMQCSGKVKPLQVEAIAMQRHFFILNSFLLVSHENSNALQPKSISLEQICYKRPQGIVATSLHCLLFSTSKNIDLKQISKSATNVV